MEKVGRMTLWVLVVGLLAMVVYLWKQQPKIAYVRLNKVYEGFDLTKEVEKKYDAVSAARQNILDSMELQLKSLGRKIETLKENERKGLIMEFEAKRNEYLGKKQQFTADNDKTVEQYNEQIWKQLNQYLEDFGKEAGYSFILGAEGSGSIMYGESGKDVTEEVKVYVNKKYKGQ